MKKILIPLPDQDFDVTEVAIPWKKWTKSGHAFTFASNLGKVGKCEPLLLTGVIFGQFHPYEVVQGNLVTARWPKDSWLYATAFHQKLTANHPNA